MALQRNDTFITISDDGSFGITDATEIVYELFSADKQTSILMKSLTTSGLTRTGANVEVHLSDDDTSALVGIYYEEIKVQAVDGAVFTAHRGLRKFKPTYITSI